MYTLLFLFFIYVFLVELGLRCYTMPLSSGCGEQALLLAGGAWASHWSSLSCAAQAPGAWPSGVAGCGLGIEPCLLHWQADSSIHCATREVQTRNHFFKGHLMLYLRKFVWFRNTMIFLLTLKIRTVYSKAYWKLFLNEYSH